MHFAIWLKLYMVVVVVVVVVVWWWWWCGGGRGGGGGGDGENWRDSSKSAEVRPYFSCVHK
jgi:hypothetical protein